MTWTLVWSERARRDLRNLDRSVARRIFQTTERWAETEHGDTIRLEGQANEYRLRVGPWRVRFSFDEARTTVTILRVLHRREAYRDR